MDYIAEAAGAAIQVDTLLKQFGWPSVSCGPWITLQIAQLKQSPQNTCATTSNPQS